MLILFDHGTPKGLMRALTGHTVVTAQAKGWDKLSNSGLFDAAEEAAVELLSPPTEECDISRTLLAGRNIAVVVLTGTTKWSRIKLHLQRIVDVVDATTAGSYREIEIPFN